MLFNHPAKQISQQDLRVSGRFGTPSKGVRGSALDRRRTSLQAVNRPEVMTAVCNRLVSPYWTSRWTAGVGKGVFGGNNNFRCDFGMNWMCEYRRDVVTYRAYIDLCTPPVVSCGRLRCRLGNAPFSPHVSNSHSTSRYKIGELHVLQSHGHLCTYVDGDVTYACMSVNYSKSRLDYARSVEVLFN